MSLSQARRHQTSGLALPLTLVYLGLIIYASLYPFSGWQFQGVMPWAFVSAPLPRYWSGFDVAINVIGYVPLGFLLTVAWKSFSSRKRSIWFAVLGVCAFAFAMEALQTYLAPRVASNADWALNTLGGFVGALLAWMAEGLGLLQSWSRFRGERFLAGSGFMLGLLVLWPLALLYPTPIALGLGYGIGQWLDLKTQMPSNRGEIIIVALGLLTPLLMSYAVIPRLSHRAVTAAVITLSALGVMTLSNGLSFGPEHATAWFSSQVQWGFGWAVVMGALLLVAPRRLCWVLLFLVLVSQLLLLGIMASDPYFAETLSKWESGQFIRFYGATQWLGRIWPYAALALVVSRLASPHKS